MTAPDPAAVPAAGTPVPEVASQPPAARSWGRRLSRLRRLGPWYAVALVAAAGVALSSLGEVRLGGYVLAGALAGGALVRAVSPRSGAGGLAVRRPWIDVVSLLGLAAAVAVAFTLVRL